MAEIPARERLERLHMALEAAVEQLTYAQQIAIRNTEMHEPPPEVVAIERLLGETTELRNRVRAELMKVLAKPTLNVIR